MKCEYLRMYRVCKSIGSITVINSIDFWLVEGEIVSIIGPSGCGKTTLAKIFAGILPIDSGVYAVCGKRINRFSVIQAKKAGIHLISRDSSLIDSMTIGENFVLTESKEFRGIDYVESIHMLAKQICQQFELDFNVYDVAASLSAEEKIILEICRAVFLKAKVLILNDVFSRLSPKWQSWLLEHMEGWKREGTSLIMLDPWMNSVTAKADRVILMNYGSIALEYEKEEYSFARTRRLMEHWMQQEFPINRKESIWNSWEQVVLHVKDLELPLEVPPISLELHSGEVVGITGNPVICRTLARTLTGRGGEIINGQIMIGDTVQSALKLRTNVGFLDETLLREGSLSSLTVQESFVLYTLIRQQHRNIITWDYEKFLYDQFCHELGMSCEAWFSKISRLPQNQQIKVLLYRWLVCRARVIVLDAPFEYENQIINREIYSFIHEASRRKIPVLITCTQREKIDNICHKILSF